MSSELRQVWPVFSEPLTDEQIVSALVVSSPNLRVNFVSSLNGATTHEGRSGGLSGDADKRHFELLRRVCDVVLVGAGTVRDEGYSAMRVSEESTHWRISNGLAPHPVFAIVSRSLQLDPRSPIFADAPARPIIVTTEVAPPDRIATLSEVADVLIAGTRTLDCSKMRTELHARKLNNILCEGGPSLFGAMLQAEVVDELFLTVSSVLEGGRELRLVGGLLSEPVKLRLASVLVAQEGLLLRYQR